MRFRLIALVLSCAYAITVHSSNFVIAPEVQKALETNNNVVALESTIISHGTFHFSFHFSYFFIFSSFIYE